MRRTGKILILVLALGCLDDLGAECRGLFERPDRLDSLEADYAQSIFRYRGGTAYYIGGEPGYLITADHVVKNSEDQSDQICSEWLPTDDGLPNCLTATVISELPSWDLALLVVQENLPVSVNALDLAFTPIRAQGNAYTIFGYSKPDESDERTWSVATGSFRQRARVESKYTSVPISQEIYHTDISQYPGASGGPLIGPTGQAWATVVKSINANQQAYAIPHDTTEFIKWILDKTEPSQEAKQLIDLVTQDGDTAELISKLKFAMDVRRRTLTNLDILHIGYSIEQYDKDLWLSVLMCPLIRATSASIEWTNLAEITRSSFSANEIAALASVKAYSLSLMALNAKHPVVQEFFLSVGGDFGVQNFTYDPHMSKNELMELASSLQIIADDSSILDDFSPGIKNLTQSNDDVACSSDSCYDSGLPVAPTPTPEPEPEPEMLPTTASNSVWLLLLGFLFILLGGGLHYVRKH